MRSADTPAVPRSWPVDPAGLASAAAIGGLGGLALAAHRTPRARVLAAVA